MHRLRDLMLAATAGSLALFLAAAVSHAEPPAGSAASEAADEAASEYKVHVTGMS